MAASGKEATGRPPDIVIANQVLPDRFDEDDVDRIEHALAVSDNPSLHAAARPALASWRRARAQEHQLGRLRGGLAAPIVELPFLFVPALGQQELHGLAAHLA
jgi:hypothetical protein